VRVAAVSLDCADPRALAEFYVRLLEGQVLWEAPSSVGIAVSGIVLACSTASLDPLPRVHGGGRSFD
jgi:hypothetical protein